MTGVVPLDCRFNSTCAARQPRRAKRNRAEKLSSLSREPWIMTPWRGQAAARWNRRATRPNAIRVSVINDRVDPVSGTWPPTIHMPGLERTSPAGPVWRCPRSPGLMLPPPAVDMPPSKPWAEMFHADGRPDGPVAKKNEDPIALTLVIVCTPSDSEKARGVTVPNGMFAARGLANVIITVTKSLVV